ncbi:MAG: helix-turn-helix transcriptional regulator [Pseudomonadota bacterium]
MSDVNQDEVDADPVIDAVPISDEDVPINAAMMPLEDTPRAVFTYVAEETGPYRRDPHRHRRAQLLYASSGVLTVYTLSGLWVLPPNRAVWMPGGVAHWVDARGKAALRYLYIEPDVRAFPETCCVIAVTGLLRELIAEVATFPLLYAEEGYQGRVIEVMLDCIAAQAGEARQNLPLSLTWPTDPQALRVAQALLAQPHLEISLEEFARDQGIGARTLARRFQAETGMGFRAWKQQVRLHEAVHRLAAGQAVTSVALDLGYDSPSAFIAMFRRSLGTSPSRYFRDA